MLFTDSVASVAHTEALQNPDRFSLVCDEFGITISLNTKVMDQDFLSELDISVSDYTLELEDNFIYLGSLISINLNLDT